MFCICGKEYIYYVSLNLWHIIWDKDAIWYVGTQEFLPLALAFLAWLPCLALAWILLSHIGKIAFLFLPYKGWTDEKEYH